MSLFAAFLSGHHKPRPTVGRPRERRLLTSCRSKVRRRLLFLEQLEFRRVLSTFAVLNTNDSGIGSIRQAIVDANNNSGGDIIEFAVGVAGTIMLTSGELSITDSVDLQGPGSSVITISGNNASRVFYVSSSVTISGLTITGGSANEGGGILNFGTLTVDTSTLSANSASVQGGGIFNYGTLTVDSKPFVMAA